jgi:hypothetical protein
LVALGPNRSVERKCLQVVERLPAARRLLILIEDFLGVLRHKARDKAQREREEQQSSDRSAHGCTDVDTHESTKSCFARVKLGLVACFRAPREFLV